MLQEPLGAEHSLHMFTYVYIMFTYRWYWCGKARNREVAAPEKVPSWGVAWGVGLLECGTDTGLTPLFPAPLQLRSYFEFRRRKLDKFEQNNAHGAEHANVLGPFMFIPPPCLIICTCIPSGHQGLVRGSSGADYLSVSWRMILVLQGLWIIPADLNLKFLELKQEVGR